MKLITSNKWAPDSSPKKQYLSCLFRLKKWQHQSSNCSGQKSWFLSSSDISYPICQQTLSLPSKYVDSWMTWVWTACVHLFVDFFSNTYLYCFQSAFGSLWMCRASCIHWSMPFYIGELSIGGILVPVGESQKLHADFRLHVVQLYIQNSITSHPSLWIIIIGSQMVSLIMPLSFLNLFFIEHPQ